MKSNIANLRESLGLTQREIALALGVTETTIANWERGRSGLDWIDRLIRLCRLLECELDDLLDYDDEDDMLEDELSFEELRALYRAGKLTQSSAR
jgi:transcriptional regulator with XRE-family HTH domain